MKTAVAVHRPYFVVRQPGQHAFLQRAGLADGLQQRVAAGELQQCRLQLGAIQKVRAAVVGQRFDDEHIGDHIRRRSRLAHKRQGPHGNLLAVHPFAARAGLGDGFDKRVALGGDAGFTLELEFQGLHRELQGYLLDETYQPITGRWAVVQQFPLEQLGVVAANVHSVDQVLEHFWQAGIADPLPMQVDFHLTLGQARKVFQGHVHQAHFHPFQVVAAHIAHRDLEHHLHILGRVTLAG